MTTKAKTPQDQFWDFVNLHFGFINEKRLDLLREQSENDDSFKIPPLGKQTEDVSNMTLSPLTNPMTG